MRQSKKQFIEFIAFYDEDKFVGFAYNISRDDLTYIFYLAVNPAIRGGGYGSKILQETMKMYDGQRFCLSAEKPDSNAENAEQRVRWIDFYHRNGFLDSNKDCVEDGVVYEMLHFGKDFEKSEYLKLQNYFLGFFRHFFKIEFID